MKKPSNPKTGKKEHNHYRWALTAFVMAVALSGLLSLSSEAILENAGLLLALLILALFIGLGILFDIIGVAVRRVSHSWVPRVKLSSPSWMENQPLSTWNSGSPQRRRAWRRAGLLTKLSMTLA